MILMLLKFHTGYTMTRKSFLQGLSSARYSTVYDAEPFVNPLVFTFNPGIAVVLFFRCMGALFDRTRRNAKRVLVAHTTAIFSIVTVYTAINLDMQSISCIDSRGFPGVNGELPPGPVGYQYFIYAKAINVVATVMFLLNGWLADGLLVRSALNPASQGPEIGHPPSFIVATLFTP